MAVNVLRNSHKSIPKPASQPYWIKHDPGFSLPVLPFSVKGLTSLDTDFRVFFYIRDLHCGDKSLCVLMIPCCAVCGYE